MDDHNKTIIIRRSPMADSPEEIERAKKAEEARAAAAKAAADAAKSKIYKNPLAIGGAIVLIAVLIVAFKMLGK